MADYGFTTYDPQTDRIEGTVNSKFPIFGPRYDQIKRCYKTFHLSDTYSQPIQTASLSLPSAVDGMVTKNEYHAYNKTLVKQIKHGFKKVPLGYCSIIGSVTKNTKMSLAFTKTADPYNTAPANFTSSGSMSSGSFPVVSSAGEPLRAATTSGSISKFAYNVMTIGTTAGAEVAIVVPNNYPMALNDYGTQIIPGDNSSTPDGYFDVRLPYSVEADDEYVYIYRLTYWCDIYSRLYRVYNGTVLNDFRARSKGAIDYAGSEVDFTIYLAPYSMKDLL